MIIAITGGSGYIGKLLVKELLREDNQVRILSRNADFSFPGAKVFYGDLTIESKALLSFTKGAEVLINCAGELNDNAQMNSVHIEGTSRLINCCDNGLKKWVQLSSVGAYGESSNLIINENSPLNPLGIYETTKTKADNLVIKSGIPYVILRPSNVFSAEMKNQSLFQLIEAIRKGYFFFIGKKGSVVNYVHVDDVVKALVMCSKSDNALNKVYNISQTLEINTMVKCFLKGMNMQKFFFHLPELPIRYVVNVFERFQFFPLTTSRINALTNFSIFDSSKIIEELNFEFGASLEEYFKLLPPKK